MTQMSGGDRSEHWQLPTHLWVPLWQSRLTMRGDWSLWNSSWTLCTPWLLLSLVPGKIQVNYGWESEYIGQLIPKPVFLRCNSPLWIFSLVSCSLQHKHKQCVLTLIPLAELRHHISVFYYYSLHIFSINEQN